MREYNKSICVKMTQEEYDKIHERMESIGIINMSAYIRKMALNGFIIDIRWPELKELLRLSNIMGNNLNQYAKKANETGSIYQEDIEELKSMMKELTHDLGKMLSEVLVVSEKEEKL